MYLSLKPTRLFFVHGLAKMVCLWKRYDLCVLRRELFVEMNVLTIETDDGQIIAVCSVCRVQ